MNFLEIERGPRIGEIVRYHGSLTEYHDLEFRVVGINIRGRYDLRDVRSVDDSVDLRNASRKSITRLYMTPEEAMA